MRADPTAEADLCDSTSTVERPTELCIRRFRVRVVSGPDRGAERESHAAELTIGTAPGNDLVLTDRTVSRHHGSISATPDGFLLRDLGSTNGTWLGRVRVQTAFLPPLTTIAIGSDLLRFEPQGGEIREPLSDEDRFGRIVGSSPAVRRLFALLPRIAASDSTVLIEGETGTGKGLFAEVLHRESPRARGPMVVVDCAALSPTLIESELFGHERGAFTGAHQARAGAFEAARGGTVFLDEIGELPLEMQPKLLRALEDRVVKRLGSTEPIQLDVRLIAASNRDLRGEVNRGAFRSDLFYRLNVVRLRIPPLRERREDIPILAAHFHDQLGGPAPGPPPELIEELSRRDLPGNVRELRSAVERALLLDEGSELSALVESADSAGAADPAASPAAPATPDVDFTVPFRAAKERVISRWERAYLGELLRRSDGNLSRAARLAQMDRNHLRDLLGRHDLENG